MALTSKTEKQRLALERRIRSFYALVNRRNFARCHQMIDPRVRDSAGSVTLFQYGNALQEFMDSLGPLAVLELHVSLHLDEPNTLYDGRDFALGKTTVADRHGQRHVFSERWVRQGPNWYTRSTGFIAPPGHPNGPASRELENTAISAEVVRSGDEERRKESRGAGHRRRT